VFGDDNAQRVQGILSVASTVSAIALPPPGDVVAPLVLSIVSGIIGIAFKKDSKNDTADKFKNLLGSIRDAINDGFADNDILKVTAYIDSLKLWDETINQ